MAPRLKWPLFFRSTDHTITTTYNNVKHTQWRHLQIAAQELLVDEKIIAARPLEPTSAVVMAAVANNELLSDRPLEN